MTRHLQVAEKVITYFLIFWGVLILYTLISALWTIFQGIGGPVSANQIFKNFHSIFFFSLMTMVGGTFLTFNKKVGWTISIAALLLNTVFFLIPTEKSNGIFVDGMAILYLCCLSLFSLIMFYILILPAYKRKYDVTRKNWWVIISIISLFILDKTLLYFAF